MNEHNAWSRGPDSQQPVDVEVEPVEAERVLTLVELAGKPIAEQLAALQGSPVQPLSVQELHWLQALARWYAGACATAGVKAPPDILRAIAACANEVVTYNQHLAAQGHPNAKPHDRPH